MIQSMMLRQCKGCFAPKELEGVLPVLDRCQYDGCDGGVVHIQGLALGLRVRNGYGVLRRRHAAVRAGLEIGP